MYERKIARLWGRGSTVLLLLAGLWLAGGCDAVPGGATAAVEAEHAEHTPSEHSYGQETAIAEKEAPVAEPAPKEAAVAPEVAHAEHALAEEGKEPVAASAEEKASPVEPVVLTDADFDRLTGKGVVLIDFWAPWCVWCRRLAPTIRKLADDYAGRAVVATLNTDENRKTPGRYGVRGLPTVVVLKDGKEFKRLEGFRPEEHLRAVLDAALGAE